MTKNVLHKKAVRIGLVLIALAVGIPLVVQLFAWADKYDAQSALHQKECWKEIYLIIEGSPEKKGDWIKQTVSNQSSALGGVDYCKTLKLIKNGPEP